MDVPIWHFNITNCLVVDFGHHSHMNGRCLTGLEHFEVQSHVGQDKYISSLIYIFKMK